MFVIGLPSNNSLERGVMELSQTAVVLWSIPVILQILLPLTLLSGFLVLRVGRHLFGMKSRPSAETRFAESLVPEKG